MANNNAQRMPENLEGDVANAWENVRSLAEKQGVDPETQPVKIQGKDLSPEALQALAAVGGANVQRDDDGDVNVQLAFSDEENEDEAEDPSIVAASKPHTFA